MFSLNGWTIAHIKSVVTNSENEIVAVDLESQDARINGERFQAINSLKMAKVHWTYALRFKDGKIVDDRILTER
jgi:hypothetical protein